MVVDFPALRVLNTCGPPAGAYLRHGIEQSGSNRLKPVPQFGGRSAQPGPRGRVQVGTKERAADDAANQLSPCQSQP